MTSLCDTRQSVLLCLALAYLSVFFSQDRIWKFHHTVPYDTSSSPFQICGLGSTVRTGHILCIYFLLLMDLHTDWRVLWNHWHELSCASVWWADTLVFWGGMLRKSIISKSLILKLTVYLDWQGSDLEISAPLCSLPSAQLQTCTVPPGFCLGSGDSNSGPHTCLEVLYYWLSPLSSPTDLCFSSPLALWSVRKLENPVSDVQT